MIKKFLRRDSNKLSKLGKGRKNKQKWRKPTGRDNKMREKRNGYPAVVSIGYKTENKKRNLLKDKFPVSVSNIKDLDSIKNNEIAVISNIGKKKKIELAKIAKEKNIEIYNLNPKTFLKKNDINKKKSKEIKKTEESKKENKK